ncbi:UbiD family decarboxylase [Actinokineospora terrae]|uniref:4-hydroxy-3-polyprenylbenzoate decarboxylase n=1 Tax=Actinokineospora terrae TaxID=155974 RepID=A0A1H9KI24_9PSEU|nr:UbiD family decarboxylase [Actinokineospora terrae]SEQ98595.1 4-hydroxy-3-polyprenylbenzoate decarboxylase [Actinokineospora terrae]
MTGIPAPRSPLADEPTALSLRAAVRKVPLEEHRLAGRVFERHEIAADFTERSTGVPAKLSSRSEMVVRYRVPDSLIPVTLGFYGDVNRVRSCLPGLPDRANHESVAVLARAAAPPVYVMRPRERWPEVDLNVLPVLPCRNAKPSITMGVVYANQCGVTSMSAHRMVVLDKTHLMLWVGQEDGLLALHADAMAAGERLAVSVNLGPPPAAMVAATLASPLWPAGRPAMAGALAGAPLALSAGVSATILADSEIVLEGYLDDTVHGGHPVLTVTAMTTRPDPTYHALLETGRERSVVLGLAGALSVAHALGDDLVTDVHHSPAGGTPLLVISVHKRCPDDDHRLPEIARRVFEHHQHGELIVFTDDDVDISCAEDVLWAIATRGTHRSEWSRGRAFVDATVPFGRTASQSR